MTDIVMTESQSKDSIKPGLTEKTQEDSKGASALPKTAKRLMWVDINVSVPQTKSKKDKKKADGGESGTPNRKIVLDKVSGIANPGETLAIMGGSGAGKTTLLNVFVNIDQDNIERTGEVLVNGEELSSKQMRKISAYVQQIDMFIGTLKVKEQLNFSAQLRMGREYTNEQRKQRVSEVIQDLGLTNAQNTIIGVPGRVKGISIGEKKRLAFACEILTDPMILFCDEPTSGLDSFMAEQVVKSLTDLAAKGKTIITTIHQPSTQVFLMFDKVCFMARGKVAYFGPTKMCCDFWKSVGPELECPLTFNPADHCIMTLSNTHDDVTVNQERIKKIREAFEESFYGKELYRKTHDGHHESHRLLVNDDLKQTKQYASSFITQLRVLFIRSLLTTIRDPLLLKVRLFQVIVTSIIIGIVNWRTPMEGPSITNLEGILYNCVRDSTFMFLFPSINVITSELPIFLREHRGGIYGVETYYLAKSFAELPQYTILPIVYSIVVCFMSNLNQKPLRVIVFALINTIQTWVAISIAYAGASIFGTDSLALTYMPVFILPMLIFGGFYINFDRIPVYFKPLSFISWFRYGFESLQVNQWIGTTIDCSSRIDLKMEYCPSTTGEGILKRRDMNENSIWVWWDFLILLLMFICYRVIALIALQLRVKFTK